MKPEICLFSIMLFLVLILSAEGVCASCVIPTENLLINQSTAFCRGTYYLNDSYGDGAIIINANNIVLDCNGTILKGKRMLNSVAVKSLHHNTTIKNCIVINYSTGVWLENNQNSTIRNITLFFATRGIYLKNTMNSNVSYNRFNKTWGIAKGGISTTSGVRFAQIYSNTIYNADDGKGIVLGSNCLNNSVFSNVIVFNGSINSKWDGIYETYINTTNNKISENTIVNAGWNGINIDGVYTDVYNNTILNARHHGIDLYNTNVRAEQVAHNRVYNNVINWTIKGVDSIGIFLENASDNEIYHNRIYSVPSLTIDGYGISVSGGDKSAYNNVSSNLIVNASTYCITSASKFTEFSRNTFTFCSMGQRINGFENKYYDTSDWHDNIFTDGVARFFTPPNGQVNYSIYGNTSAVYIFVFASGGVLMINYSGGKTFNVLNSTISLWDCTTPNNDIYNLTAHKLIATNVQNYSLSIGPGQEIRVGDYTPDVCGDLVCSGLENCSTCENDCGSCPVLPFCGDSVCNGNETCSSCSQDCGNCPYCGDNVCNNNENCNSCSHDCGVCQGGGSGGGGGGGGIITKKPTNSSTNSSRQTTNLSQEQTKNVTEENYEQKNVTITQNLLTEPAPTKEEPKPIQKTINLGNLKTWQNTAITANVSLIILSIVVFHGLRKKPAKNVYQSQELNKKRQELKDWVTIARNHNIPDGRIMHVLVRNGWKEKVVLDLLRNNEQFTPNIDYFQYLQKK